MARLQFLANVFKKYKALLRKWLPRRTHALPVEPRKYVSTNQRVFYAIAREAVETMKELDAKHIRPKPDGQPGFIKTLDPEQKSFKNAFVCVVFCGVYLDALLHLRIARKFGIEKSKELDHRTYEVKLKRMGCRDKMILADTKRFRLARNEIVHEKAMLNADDFKVAQDEAAFAFDLVERIRGWFGITTTGNYKSLWESTETSHITSRCS